MNIKYVAFDVETPNHLNNRISSIGVTTIDENGNTSTQEILVNPECEFDRFNIDLTHITPMMVETAPTFPKVWENLEPLFFGHILVAHNASFDLCVLQKVLAYYQLTAPSVQYLCTMRMARSAVPCVCDHKLSTLCNNFGIGLNHHNAGSDSEACAKLLLNLLDSGVSAQSFLRPFDLSGTALNQPSFRRSAPNNNTRSLNEMADILQAISSDGVLTSEEILSLVQWMEDNSFLKGNFPYDRIYNKLSEVLEDGVVTEQEHAELIELFQTAADPVKESKCPCEELNVNGKGICLTGEFDCGSRSSVSSMLEEQGAIMQPGVTKKTDILVVGGQGSTAWSSGNYGSKIKKALELQTKGAQILIIRESDFFKMIGKER